MTAIKPWAASCDAPYAQRSTQLRPARVSIVALAACTLFVWLAGSAAALTCDTALGVTMTARHYNFDLEEMPDWSDDKCVAEETKTVSTISLPVSATDAFAISIDGDDFDSNVAIVFEAYFDIPIDFTKFFQLNSTDGSKLYIDDVLVINHDGLHDFTGSATPKVPLPGPKRFKLTVQYFKGAISTGSGLVLSWGDLRQLYPNPFPASELKVNGCTANVLSPPPAAMSSPPPAAVPAPKPDTRVGTPPPSGRPVKRTLPKACGGRCAPGPRHLNKRPPPPRIERTLPPACHGKCNKKVGHKRKLPKACGGRCATMKPKTSGRKGRK